MKKCFKFPTKHGLILNDSFPVGVITILEGEWGEDNSSPPTRTLEDVEMWTLTPRFPDPDSTLHWADDEDTRTLDQHLNFSPHQPPSHPRAGELDTELNFTEEGWGLSWRKFAAMDQFEDDLERLAASGLQSARWGIKPLHNSLRSSFTDHCPLNKQNILNF